MKITQKWFFAFVLTTIVIILLAQFFRPPSHLLLDKATRVSSVRLSYPADGYLWLFGHDLLIFHPGASGQWTIVRRNVQSGVETPLPLLGALFQQTGGDPVSGKVSPDGRRLIWAGLGKRIYGATVEGKNFQQWPYAADEYGISYWLPDNCHFLRYRGSQFFDPRPTVLRSVATPKIVKHLPFDWQQDAVQTSAELAPLLTLPGRVYAEACTDRTPPDDCVTVSSLGMNKVRQRFRQVPLPPGFAPVFDSDPRFLSDGQWLIWTMSAPPASHVPLWLQNLMTRLRLGPKPSLRASAWISHADGTEWRFVGDWVEPSNLPYWQEQSGAYPYNFRWLPGEGQVSFEYQNGLYTAPVNERK